MKNILLLSIICTSFITIVAQAQIPPQFFNYSAVARDANSNPIAVTTIGIQLSIRQTSTLGSILYQENHFVNTDQFGLFNLIIGAGAGQIGNMTAIDWSVDNYYLQVGMDANGGTNFLTMGTTQLLSVPYALHAASTGSINGVNFSGAQDGDVLIFNGSTQQWESQTAPSTSINITGTGGTTITGTSPNFTVNSTDAQSISLVGDVLSIQNGNSISLPLNLNSYGYSVLFNGVPIYDPAINDLMLEPNVFLSENNYIYKLLNENGDVGNPRRYNGVFASIEDQFNPYLGSVYYANAGCTGTRYLGEPFLVGQVFGTTNGISYISDSATPTSVSTNSYRSVPTGGCTNQSQAISAYTVLPNNPAITGVHITTTTPIQIEIVR